MKKLLFVLTAAVIVTSPRPAQAQDKFSTTGKIERIDPRFEKLVPKDARMELLAEGFKWTEGPVWMKTDGHLLFSDIPNNTINMWKPGSGIKLNFIKPSGYTGDKPRGGEPGSNGLTVNADGLLTLCEHGDRRVTQIDKAGKKTVLADKYMGKRFNSPNDLVFHSSGALYFTDPPYGLELQLKDPACELDFCGVYRLKDGKVELLTKELSRPNGIALSPDEKTLYVANSDEKKAIWMAYPVQADGTIGKGKVFFDATKWAGTKKGLPDGMRVDLEGNLFATGPGGVLVFAPDGTHLGTLDTGVPTANCGWGEDGSTLYITANTTLLRIRLSTKGKI
jgi:gluconolactonase